MMERKIIVQHVRKKRKVVILTFALLLLAFLENYYLNCVKAYSPTTCALGWIYVVLAAVVALVAFYYRK